MHYCVNLESRSGPTSVLRMQKMNLRSERVYSVTDTKGGFPKGRDVSFG